MSTDLEPQPHARQTKAEDSAPASSSPLRVRSRREPPAQSSFPGWSIMAMAVIAMVVLLVLGVSFSHLATPQTPGPSQATASSGGTTNTTSSANTATTPAAVPAHQTYNPQAPVALQGNTVNVTLTVKEVLISIAPNVAYHAWTFNGTVPGPVIRVRQGQTVHFTLVNDGMMSHSIDFHAAQTPWNVNYQEVGVGKSFSFDWKANYPGVFMYHCGAPVVIYHMANGMYGTIIVDPAQGWAPAQEYVLVQSEFYTAQQPDGTYAVDASKLAAGTPDYVVFNGYVNQYKTSPINAKVGKRIRIFLVNAGPTLFSAFHVIGAIFSDTYADGNPANHMVGNQTVTIPPGGGMVVELTIPEAGQYPFVTHSFEDVGKGALGVLNVTP